ncbi:hypothetical protein AVEN_63417-1 [Araneus ventricosus]|uniref:Uncharacterized protein n=1 Tax=Araneus ventricosus TaxID=182803 RepID=A0A4Y2K768_ARAVE|nr:hypothetical protein AVEN_63417-1 [Araneus ventricosus]
MCSMNVKSDRKAIQKPEWNDHDRDTWKLLFLPSIFIARNQLPNGALVDVTAIKKMSEGDGVTVPRSSDDREPDVNQMEVAAPVSNPTVDTSVNLTSLLCAAEAPSENQPPVIRGHRCLQLNELTKQLKRPEVLSC